MDSAITNLLIQSLTALPLLALEDISYTIFSNDVMKAAVLYIIALYAIAITTINIIEIINKKKVTNICFLIIHPLANMLFTYFAIADKIFDISARLPGGLLWLIAILWVVEMIRDFFIISSTKTELYIIFAFYLIMATGFLGKEVQDFFIFFIGTYTFLLAKNNWLVYDLGNNKNDPEPK